MADTSKSTRSSKITPGEGRQTQVVQSTTDATPAEADKTSLPNAMDAKPHDPPVRAATPDTAIAQTLAAGAGKHTPPPDGFNPDGRPTVTGVDSDGTPEYEISK
jgi:hypothetical protein